MLNYCLILYQIWPLKKQLIWCFQLGAQAPTVVIFRFVGCFILSGQAKHRLMQCWLPQFYLPIMRLIESISLKQIWLSKWRLWPFLCLFCVLGHWFVTMSTTVISHTKKWYASNSSDPTLTIACKKRSGLSLKPIKRPKSVLPAPFNVSQFSLHVKVKIFEVKIKMYGCN